MAPKLSFLSMLFVLLLLAFSPVLGENQGPRDVDVNQFKDDKHGGGYGYGHGGGHGYGHGGGHGYGHGGGGHGYGHGGGHGCRYYCGRRCCSAVEYAEFVQKGVEDMHGDHHSPCRHCGKVCCSDEEYAEYVKKGAADKYGH